MKTRFRIQVLHSIHLSCHQNWGEVGKEVVAQSLLLKFLEVDLMGMPDYQVCHVVEVLLGFLVLDLLGILVFLVD